MITLKRINGSLHQIKCIKSFTTVSGEFISMGTLGGCIEVEEFILPHIIIDRSWIDEGVLVSSYVRITNSHIKCNIPKTLMCLEIENTVLDKFPEITNQNTETFKTVKIIPFNRKIFSIDGITISDIGYINYQEHLCKIDVYDPEDEIFVFLSCLFISNVYFDYSLNLIGSRCRELTTQFNLLQGYNNDLSKRPYKSLFNM